MPNDADGQLVGFSKVPQIFRSLNPIDFQWELGAKFI